MKKNENMEIKRILDILKSKKILIAFILIVFTLLGYLYSYYYVIPEYKSTATLLLIPNNVSANKTITNLELSINSELITTYSNIAKNPKVLKQTISNLDLNMTEQQLLHKMQVNMIENTYIIEISISNTDAQKAMDITNELSKVFLNEIKDIYHLNNIGVVDEAQLSQQPYNINHMKDIIMFFAIGIIISIAYVTMIYMFENTLKEEEDIENYIKIKSLGNIPINHDKNQEIIDKDNAKSYITECMNTIRTNILYMNSAKNAKTILITSCTPQEGKSWVSANIAVSFAKINKKVLIIDADMRKGRAHGIFKVNNTEGLSNYLHAMTGEVKKDIELGKDYIKETTIPNLHILTNGTVPPNPSELIDSNNMKELIGFLKNIYDIIIVDAPPCKLVTDSIILSTIIDSTVLVVNSRKTKINDLNEVKKAIKVVGGEIIGAILNKKKVTQKTYRENYYYGHSKQENIKTEQEKEIEPVNKIIEEAIIELEKRDFDILPKEKEAIEKLEEKENRLVEEDENQENIKEFFQKQNDYLEKMSETVLDKNTAYAEELNKILEQLEEVKQESKNTAYAEELNKILDQLEEVKQESKNVAYTEELNKILNQLEEVKQNNFTNSEQMKEMVRKEISKLEDIKEEKLTKEQVESIIKQEISHIDHTQDMEKIYQQIEETKNHTSEMIREMINRNKEELLNTIKDKEESEEQIQSLVNREIAQMQEEVQKILEQEITKMNYTEQIIQINEILTDLKDSYLELSNRIRTNTIENEEIDSKNIIDMKAFRRQRNKKKVYSIEEEIPYQELEKTATYIIPIQRKVSGSSSEETYESTMW